MLDTIIHLDQQLLLFFNGMHCGVMDMFMWQATRTVTWVPLHVFLLYVLWVRLKDWRLMLLAIAGVALVVLCSDQFASGLCKNYFCRPRPSHEPALDGLVHIVNGYRGGAYGFISSHAANTFGVATFLGMLVKKRYVTTILFLWAVICSYSRIYLGVHYPGDIVCGALAGMIIGWTIHLFYNNITFKLKH